MPYGLYSLLTACSYCHLWLHILRLGILLQALELPRIGWADNASVLSDHTLTTLKYRVSCACHLCSRLLGVITSLTGWMTICKMMFRYLRRS